MNTCQRPPCATGEDLNHSPRRLTQCEQYVNMLMLLLIFKCEIPCLIYDLFLHLHLAILSSQCRFNIGDIVWRMLRFIQHQRKKKNRRNFGEVIIYNVVFNPFSSRFGLPLHNTPFPGLLMKSIGALFYDRISFLASTACVLHLY